jgi:hypothetical protein
MDGTYIDTVEYRIFRRGRKWLQAETRTGRPARIQIDEQSAAFAVGETYSFFAKVKAFDFTLRDSEKRILRTDILVLPADYRPTKQERKSTLRYCIGCILEGAKADKPYLNSGAVRRGVAAGPADFPALEAEFGAAILQASTSKSTLDAEDAIIALEAAENDQERDEARRTFRLALAEVGRHAGSLAEWLKAKYAKVNHAATYRKGEQMTMFAA